MSDTNSPTLNSSTLNSSTPNSDAETNLQPRFKPFSLPEEMMSPADQQLGNYVGMFLQAKQDKQIEDEYFQTLRYNTNDDEETRFARADAYFAKRYGIETHRGAIINSGHDYKMKPFDSAAAYEQALVNLAEKGYEAIASDRYKALVAAERMEDEAARRAEICKLGKIQTLESVVDVEQQRFVDAGSPMPPTKLVPRKPEDIDRDIAEYRATVLGENYMALFEHFRPDLSEEGERIVRNVLKNGSLTADQRGAFKALYAADPKQGDLVSFLCQQAKETEYDLNGAAGRGLANMFFNIFGQSWEKIDQGLTRMGNGFDAMDYAWTGSNGDRMARMNREERDEYERLRAEGMDEMTAIDKVAGQMQTRYFRQLMSSDDRIRSRRVELALKDLMAKREWEHYGYWENAYIGAATTIPYMGVTAIPYAGFALNVFAHMQDVEDQIIREGGDPSKAVAARAIGAITWAAIEKMELKGFGRSLTKLEKTVMWRHIWKRQMKLALGELGSAAPIVGKDLLINWAKETVQEGMQGAIESIEKDLGLDRDAATLFKNAIERSLQDTKDSAGTMAIIGAAFPIGAAIVRAPFQRRRMLDRESVMEYITRQEQLMHMLEGAYQPEAETPEMKNKRVKKAYNEIQNVWDASATPMIAIEKYQEMGYTEDQAVKIAEHFDMHSEILRNAAALAGGAEQELSLLEDEINAETDPRKAAKLKKKFQKVQARIEGAYRDAAIAGNAFRIGNDTTFDVEGFYHLVSPGSKIEQVDVTDPEGSEGATVKTTRITRTFKDKDGNDVQKSVTVRTDYTKPNIDTYTFGQSVSAEIMPNVGQTLENDFTIKDGKSISTDDFKALDGPSKTTYAVTPEQWMAMTHEERAAYLEAHNLKEGGNFTINDEHGREIFNSDGLITIKRARSVSTRPGGNFTLAHEDAHFAVAVGRSLGMFGDAEGMVEDPSSPGKKKLHDTVALMRKIFGDPTGTNELWNEDAMCNGYSRFLRDKFDFHGLSEREASLLRRIFNAITQFIKDCYRRVFGRNPPPTQQEIKTREQAMDAVFEGIRTGDFSGLSAYAGIDFGEDKAEAASQDAQERPATASAAETKNETSAPKEAAPAAPGTVSAPSAEANAAEERVKKVHAAQNGVKLTQATPTQASLQAQLARIEAKLAELTADPNGAAANVPTARKAPKGEETRSTPQGGVKFKIAWQWIPRAELVTSDKAEYPQEFQPRDRASRVASDLQVIESTRPGRFDPMKLAYSYDSDGGAPIVAGGNVVLSGNGRSMMLAQLSQEGRYADYLSKISEWADEYGIGRPPAGMKEPVLVQRITSTDRRDDLLKIAELSNQTKILTRSEAENAEADAKLITPTMMRLFRPSEDGDLLAATNADFMQAFIAAAPDAKGLTNADGTPTDQCVRRVQNALLSAVLGQDQTTRALLKTLLEKRGDLGLGDLYRALIKASGALLSNQASKKAFDLLPHVRAAVLQYVAWRSARLSNPRYTLDEHLRTSDMFAAAPSKETEAVTRLLEAGRFGRVLDKYNELVAQKAPDAQASFFAEDTAYQTLAKAERAVLAEGETPVTLDPNDAKAAEPLQAPPAVQAEAEHEPTPESYARHSVRVNPRLREEVEAALNTDRSKGEVVKGGRRIVFCESPRLFEAIGIPRGTVYTKAHTLRKIAKEHALTSEQIASAPELLERPAAVFDDNGEGYVFLTDATAPDEDGVNAPVMFYVRPDGQGNYVASAYARKEKAESKYANLVNAGKVLYFDKNKVTRLPLRGEAQSSLNTFNAGDKVVTPERVTALIISQNDAKTQERFSVGRLYTGSAADYEKPSLHHVGKSNGVAFGWGIYATTDREDGERFGNNVYEQTFFTNRAPGDESHLIEWDKEVSPENQNRILVGLVNAARHNENLKKKIEDTIREEEDELGVDRDADDYNPPDVDGMPDDILRDAVEKTVNVAYANGSEVYRELARALSGKNVDSLDERTDAYKMASEFLRDECDIDGIKYPASMDEGQAKNASHYVSFRDDNIRVDHKWTDGEQRFSVRLAPELHETLTLEPSDEATAKASVKAWRAERKAFTNRRNGRTAELKADWTKIFSEPAKKKSANYAAHYAAANRLDTLFENGVRMWEESPRNGSRDIRAYAKYGCPFEFGGETYLAKITVKEYADGKSTDGFYSIEAISVEKISAGGINAGITSIEGHELDPGATAVLKDMLQQTPRIIPNSAAERNGGEPRHSVRRGRSPMKAEDVAAGFLAARFLAGKETSVEDADRMLKNIGIRVDAPAMLERARALADRNRDRLRASVQARNPEVVATLARANLADRATEAFNTAITTGAAAADPDIGVTMQRTAERFAARELQAAKGFTAALMQAELPISLPDAVFAVAELEKSPEEKARLEAEREKRERERAEREAAAAEEGESPVAEAERLAADESYQEPTAEESVYFYQLMDRARFAEEARQQEELRRKLAEEKARKEAEGNADNADNGDNADDEGDGEGGQSAAEESLPFETVRRIAPVFESADLFAQFLIEWTTDHILQKHPELANRADLWKSPVAIKELVQTAQNILRDLAKDTLGSPSINAARNYADQAIINLADYKTFRAIRRNIARIYDRIHDNALRISRRKLVNELIYGKRDSEDGPGFKGLRALAGIKGRFSATTEAGDRAIDAKTELWCRWLIPYLTMTEEKMQAEEDRLRAIIARHDTEDAEYGYNKEDNTQYAEAKDRLALLNVYGGMVRWLPGKIIDAREQILEQVNGKRQAFEQARAEREAEDKKIRDAIIAAVEAGASDDFRHHSEMADRLDRLLYSMNGNLTLEMQNLIRYCRDPEKREAALLAIEYLATLISRGTEQYRVTLAQARKEVNDGLAAYYGNAERGIRHLMHDQLPEDVAKRIFTQSREKVQTYGQLLQLYATTLQADYKENAEKHGRTAMLQLMEETLTPQDIQFHAWAVNWYAANRAALSDAVEEITGLGVTSPDRLYCPARMDRDPDGFSTDAVAWSPVPSALNRRVVHGLDFNESANFLTLLMEQAEVRAQTIGYGMTGIRLRNILAHHDLQKAVRKNVGRADMRLVTDHVKDVLVQGAAKKDAIEWLAPLNFARKWMARFYLSGNIPSALKQLASMPVWANAMLGGQEIGLKRCIGYLTSVGTEDGRQAIEDLIKSDGFKARYQMGWSEEIQNLLSHPSKNRLVRYFERAYDKGMLVNKGVDAVSCLWMAQGFYRDAKALFERRGFTPEQAKENALALTWSVCENGQQSGRIENMNKAQRHGGALVSAVFQFKTAFLLQNNYIIQAFRDVRSGTPGAKGRLARGLFINTVYIPAFVAVVNALWDAVMGEPEPPEDPEKAPQWLKDFAWSMIDGVTAPLFMTGSILHATFNQLFGKTGYDDNAALPAVEGIMRVGKHAGKALADTISLITPMDVAEEVTPEKVKEDLLRLAADIAAPVRHVRKVIKNREK